MVFIPYICFIEAFMITVNKLQFLKIFIYVISIIILFNLMSREYTNWIQKLNCQDKCAIQGYKSCIYTPENYNKGQSERCQCGFHTDIFLILD